MTMHKTPRDLALKHKVPLQRNAQGYYFYVRDWHWPGTITWSMHTTAKSGLALVRRYLREQQIICAAKELQAEKMREQNSRLP